MRMTKQKHGNKEAKKPKQIKPAPEPVVVAGLLNKQAPAAPQRDKKR
jgi:hypothetical protein